MCKTTQCALSALIATCLIASAACAATVFDSSAATPFDERQVLPAWLGFRPADGQVCEVNPRTGEDFYEQVERALKGKGGAWDRNFTNSNIWITTKTPSHRRTFLAVIAPWRAGDAEPAIERLSDAEVRVLCPGEQARTIGFGTPGEVKGDIVVDYVDVREKCSSEAVRGRMPIPTNVVVSQ